MKPREDLELKTGAKGGVCVGQGSRRRGTEIATREEEVETRSREGEKMGKDEEEELDGGERITSPRTCFGRLVPRQVLRFLPVYGSSKVSSLSEAAAAAAPSSTLPSQGQFFGPSRWESANLTRCQTTRDAHVLYLALRPISISIIHTGSRDGRRRLEKWLVPGDSSSP